MDEQIQAFAEAIVKQAAADHIVQQGRERALLNLIVEQCNAGMSTWAADGSDDETPKSSSRPKARKINAD